MFPSLDPFEGMAQRPMSLNGYSYVEGNPVNWVDPSGMCPENPGALDVFGWRCRFLAEGIAARTGQPVQNFMWMDYGQLEALTAVGTAAGVTGGARQFVDNAAVLPNLFYQNPAVALQALQTYLSGCNNSPELLIGGFFTIPKLVEFAPQLLLFGAAVGIGLGITLGAATIAGEWSRTYSLPQVNVQAIPTVQVIPSTPSRRHPRGTFILGTNNIILPSRGLITDGTVVSHIDALSIIDEWMGPGPYGILRVDVYFSPDIFQESYLPHFYRDDTLDTPPHYNLEEGSWQYEGGRLSPSGDMTGNLHLYIT